MDFVSQHLIAIMILAAIVLGVVQLLSRIRPSDPAKMQMLMGRQPISDSDFHSNYYPNTQQTLVTTARYLFANRARVPHKLLLPTDRLADFGIQELGDFVMSGVKKHKRKSSFRFCQSRS